MIEVPHFVRDFGCGLPLPTPSRETARAGDPGFAHARKTPQLGVLAGLGLAGSAF
jgi:hypothetical protein